VAHEMSVQDFEERMELFYALCDESCEDGVDRAVIAESLAPGFVADPEDDS
jgi:hypothetical protein